MNRLTLGIFFSLIIIMVVSAQYIPSKVVSSSASSTCQTGIVCSKADCCNKVVNSTAVICEKPCCSKT